MGAASAIHDQAERLSVEKIQALSQTVLDEAQHLNRMTTNTLQLARLDSSPLRIRKDWESVHEFLVVVNYKYDCYIMMLL
jgi:two-component system sensor histidine kinase KdpD